MARQASRTVELFQESMKELEEPLVRSVRSMLSTIVLPVQQNATEVKPRKKAKKGKTPNDWWKGA